MPDALVPDGPGREGRAEFTAAAGGLPVRGGAWSHPDAAGPYAPLAGALTFSWSALEWFEDDERATVHARDPHERVDTLRSSRRVLVGGAAAAHSVRPLRLIEAALPPPAAVAVVLSGAAGPDLL